MLLLVLFFLVTGTIVETEEQSVALPETLDLPLDRLPRPLLLVDPAGPWTLDGAPVTAEDLPGRLEAMAEAGGPSGPVHLLAARGAPAEVVLAAMTALAGSGRRVLLVTLTRAAGTRP